MAAKRENGSEEVSGRKLRVQAGTEMASVVDSIKHVHIVCVDIVRVGEVTAICMLDSLEVSPCRNAV